MPLWSSQKKKHANSISKKQKRQRQKTYSLIPSCMLLQDYQILYFHPTSVQFSSSFMETNWDLNSTNNKNIKTLYIKFNLTTMSHFTWSILYGWYFTSLLTFDYTSNVWLGRALTLHINQINKWTGPIQ